MASHPSILAQGHPVTLLPNSCLIPSRGQRQFNPGLTLAPNGTMWMAYRIQSILADGAGRIVLCRLEHGRFPVPNSHQVLDLPLPTGGEHHEDPRLFWHKGHLHLAYTEAYGYHGAWTCAMRLVRLNWDKPRTRWNVDAVIPLRYGNNDKGREKNWQFFSHEDQLMCVYSLKPHVVLAFQDNGQVVKEYVTSGIQGWGHGTLSGGTPPIRKRGGLVYVSVFHSAEPHRFRTRRYNASLYEFRAKPPFGIVGVTPRPFIYGSEADGFSPEPKGATDPCVVFPGGAVQSLSGRLLLSVGINDWRCALLELDPAQLMYHNAVFPQVTRYFWTRYAAAPVVIDREVRATWQHVELVGETWAGVLQTSDPNIINQLKTIEDVREITEAEFRKYGGIDVPSVPQNDRAEPCGVAVASQPVHGRTDEPQVHGST